MNAYYPKIDGQVHLNNFLETLSAQTGTRFTVEAWISTSGDHGPNLTSLDPALISSDWDAKTAIETYFPGYAVTPSVLIAGVYHVIDRRLFQLADYALDSPIPSVVFSGTASEYESLLASKVVGVKVGRWAQNPSPANILPRRTDPTVSVSFQDRSLRDALTLCIDNVKSGAICWVSTTSVTLRSGSSHFNYTSLAKFKNSP